MCKKKSNINPENPTVNPEVLKHYRKIERIKNAEFVCTGLLLLAILASLTTIVVVQFTSDNPTDEMAAQIVNTYTGIILGFVAMTVSLIGMVLSFHNTKQAEESNLDSIVAFTNLHNSVSEIAEIEKNLSKTLGDLERNMVNIDCFKTIEIQLEKLAKEMRNSYDMNKGSATEKATTTPVKKEVERMLTDEHP